MSDTIYREDAIKAVKSSIADGWGRISPVDACQNIRCLPSVDRPQKVIAQITFDEEKLREIVKEAVERFKEEYEIVDRPQEEWISKHNGYWTCSECGLSFLFYAKGNFCPNCGAVMRKEGE